MPAINGLYAAVLPSAAYTFFGSSMQLAVGPVALVSLLTGTLVSQYGAEPYSQDAVNVGTQASLSVGIILTVLSLLNLGSLVHYIAQPVMSGFTTGAAMIIGLQQLKNAFGFNNKPPQVGQSGYNYNYQIMKWYHNHWNTKETLTTGKSPNYVYTEVWARNFLATHVILRIHFIYYHSKYFDL
jgi:MFS superfamily sulfate permease-like transporter